jgi:hypothetical protein
MLPKCVWVAILLQATAGCQLATSNLQQESSSLDAQAIDLIAIGAISGDRADRSAATSNPLENGVAGNLLGGLGSGLAYAGGNIFLALPDRGPNAVAYEGAVDDTSSYIVQFQTLRMRLEPVSAGAALPFELGPVLLHTTLLHSIAPLHYAAGTEGGLDDGAPALNAAAHTHFFTRRSDNFDPATLSIDAHDGRLDPEGVRVSNDGFRVFVSDECGRTSTFDRITGARLRSFARPRRLRRSR